jgi:protein-disulfide isomerase
MESDNIESVKNKWHNRWWGIVFLLILVILVLGSAVFIYNLVYFLETESQANINNAVNNQVQIETADDPSLGAAQPSITIVEFGDFQCPYCQQEYLTLRRVVMQYPEVKLIFRDFPISATHPDALGAALGANCANEQNKFWEYHDLLFNNQADLTIENLLLFAQDLNLDFNQFSACLGDQKYLNEIQNDLLDGMKLGITGTPTFFVNGYKVTGVVSYDTWVDILERYKQLINDKK